MYYSYATWLSNMSNDRIPYHQRQSRGSCLPWAEDKRVSSWERVPANKDPSLNFDQHCSKSLSSWVTNTKRVYVTCYMFQERTQGEAEGKLDSSFRICSSLCRNLSLVSWLVPDYLILSSAEGQALFYEYLAWQPWHYKALDLRKWA